MYENNLFFFIVIVQETDFHIINVTHTFLQLAYLHS